MRARDGDGDREAGPVGRPGRRAPCRGWGAWARRCGEPLPTLWPPAVVGELCHLVVCGSGIGSPSLSETCHLDIYWADPCGLAGCSFIWSNFCRLVGCLSVLDRFPRRHHLAIHLSSTSGQPPAAWLAIQDDLSCLVAHPCPSQTLTPSYSSVGLPSWPLLSV